MKRVFKIGIFLLLLGAVAAFAGMEYLNRVLLPGKVRAWAERTCSEAVGRKVAIGRIRFGLLSGVVLEQVDVEEDSRYGKDFFLQIDQVSGKILYLPILKKQQIIIPSLQIVRPRIQILQDSNGIWNVRSLAFLAPKEGGAGSRFRVLVPKIVIERGQAQTSFKTPGHWVRLNFTDLNAQLGLALPAKIRWLITTKLEDGFSTSLRLEGSYDLPERQFTLQNRTTLPLETLIKVLPDRSKLPLTSLQGSSSIEMNLTGKLEGPYALSGFLQTQGLIWKLRELPKPKWLAQGLEGEGDLRVTVHGQIPSFDSFTLFKDGEAFVELRRMNLSSVPVIGELRSLTGGVRIRPDGIRTEEMTAALASGERVSLSGSLVHDGKETFALRAGATLPLNQLPPIVPLEVQTLTQIMKLAGQVNLEATGEGHLKPTFSFRPTLTATLQNGSVDLPEAGNIRDAAGSVRWRPDLLTVTDLKGKFRNLPFQIEGSLVNLARPEVDAKVSWGSLEAQARLTVDGNRAEIHTLSGHYGSALFRILGEINGWEEPVGNLYGETTVELEDLPALLPNLPKELNPFPLRGSVSTRWIQKGPLLKPNEWEFGLKGTSPALIYVSGGQPHQEIPFEKAAFDVERTPGLIAVHSATLKLSGGTVTGSGVWHTSDPGSPWAGKISAQELDMASISQTLNWKTQNLSGRLFLNLEAGGGMKQLSSLKGTGTVQIRGGQILELPFLGRFADLVNFPALKTIVFQEAEGPFVLEDGNLRTALFQLKSPQATLTLMGSGGYLNGVDSPIRWRIFPTLSAELIPEEARSMLGRVIAKGASYLVGEIRITGTWKNPKSTFVPKQITQILNEQLFNLQDVLKDLF